MGASLLDLAKSIYYVSSMINTFTTLTASIMMSCCNKHFQRTGNGFLP